MGNAGVLVALRIGSRPPHESLFFFPCFVWVLLPPLPYVRYLGPLFDALRPIPVQTIPVQTKIFSLQGEGVVLSDFSGAITRGFCVCVIHVLFIV